MALKPRTLKDIAAALRLPFLTASILPFIAGSLAAKDVFSASKFLLGLTAVAAMHLGANLFNDYADSKSGADWQDKAHYGFFGGSKLIQDGVFSESSFLKWAVIFFAASFVSVFALALMMKSEKIIFYCIAIFLLAVAYSHMPFQLAYRRLGEFVIFLLFGPALVMGGYFIQTGIFPSLRSFILSLPFAFLAAAILFANEVPDYIDDKKVGKDTWVSMTGQGKAFVVYGALVAMAFAAIGLNVSLGILRPIAFVSFISIALPVKAAMTLKNYPQDKIRLVNSSKLTVALHAVVSLILIAGVAR